MIVNPHVHVKDNYLLANEIVKGYSNATVRPSVRPSDRPSVTSL